MCNCNYCNDTEDENSFWANVYYQMEVNKCDKETSINAVMKFTEKCILLMSQFYIDLQVTYLYFVPWYETKVREFPTCYYDWCFHLFDV